MNKYNDRPQDRNGSGKFKSSPLRPDGRMIEEDRLAELCAFRVTNRDWRRLMVLFQVHRAQFGWQVHADMFRSMLLIGLGSCEEKIKNPTPEMEDLKNQHEELEQAAHMAMRHTNLDAAIKQVDEDINTAMRAGDLGAVRMILDAFKERTKAIKRDYAIRARRELEFERLWGKLYDSIRPASLRQFVNEEDEG